MPSAFFTFIVMSVCGPATTSQSTHASLSSRVLVESQICKATFYFFWLSPNYSFYQFHLDSYFFLLLSDVSLPLLLWLLLTHPCSPPSFYCCFNPTFFIYLFFLHGSSSSSSSSSEFCHTWLALVSRNVRRRNNLARFAKSSKSSPFMSAQSTWFKEMNCCPA